MAETRQDDFNNVSVVKYNCSILRIGIADIAD